MTAAMKAREELKKSTLRMALSAITNAEVAGTEAVELNDEQVIKVLQAEAKKRMESAEVYEQNGRADAAAQEKAEAAAQDLGGLEYIEEWQIDNADDHGVQVSADREEDFGSEEDDF